MRHRAPRHLSALLRLRRTQPRRAAGAPTRPGLRLVAALASVVMLLTGAVVVAGELGDDHVAASDTGRTGRLRTIPDASRSDGRTPWPTTTGTPAEDAGADPTTQTPSAPEQRPEAGSTDATREPATERPAPTPDAPLVPSVDATAHLRTPVPTPDLGAVPTPERTGPTATPGASDDPGTESPTPTATGTAPDDTAPQTTLDSGPDQREDSNEAEFAFHASEPASFTCSIDGEPFEPCASEEEYDGLDDGWHEFTVRARDDAGNVDPSPAQWRWHIAERDDQDDRGDGDHGGVPEIPEIPDLPG